MNSYQQSSSQGGERYQSMQMQQHQQQQMRKQLKKKLSIVFRDRDEIPHRKGVNSIVVDNTNTSPGQSLIFTASRDRLIKLWHVNYESQQYDLKANLDEHTDWVNQILYNSQHKILFSCSNDTTIKLWSLSQILKNLKNTKQSQKSTTTTTTPNRLTSIMTLNDDSDYVRAMDYNLFKSTLYSVCDSGIVRLWDINLGQIVSSINPHDSPSNRVQDKNLIQRSNELLKIDQALPTSISCSQGGSVVAIGFTDEVIRVVDTRIRNKSNQMFELRGEHTDIIKQVQLSPEGMVCLSAGSDCSFKMWDLSTRKCIKTYGAEEGMSKKNSDYHKDSITTFDVLFDSDLAFTGGRDGTIFQNKIVKNTYSQIHQDPRKLMITSVKFDEVNNMLWYSTPDSDIQCLKYTPSEDMTNDLADSKPRNTSQNSLAKPYLDIKGLPQITEYHILKNKRYILTNTTDRAISANLWSLETGQIIKTWKSSDGMKYDEVKKFVNDNFDIGGQNSQVKKSDVIPQSWFSCDVKLGSLTIHLDEDNWLKGNVIDNDTNIERMLQQDPQQQPKSQQDNQIDFNKQRIRQTQAGEVMQKALNLGFNLSEKLFRAIQAKYTEVEQKKLQKLLGDNYQDYVRLKNAQQQVNKINSEESKDNTGGGNNQIDDDEERLPFFTFLMEAETQKPIWTSYGDDPQEVDKFVHYMPLSMRKHIQQTIPNLDSQNKISLGINTVHVLDLPKFQEGKRLTCAPSTPIFELIEFLSSKLEFQKQFLMPASQFDPLKYVEIVMPVKYPQSFQQSKTRPQTTAKDDNQSQSQSQLSDKPYDDLIVLDKSLTLVIIQKLLLPYSGMTNTNISNSTQSTSQMMSGSQYSSSSSSQQMNLLYRKKQIDYSKTFNVNTANISQSITSSASKELLHSSSAQKSSGGSSRLNTQNTASPNDGDNQIPDTIETFRNVSQTQTPDKTQLHYIGAQQQQQMNTMSNGKNNGPHK